MRALLGDIMTPPPLSPFPAGSRATQRAAVEQRCWGLVEGSVIYRRSTS